MSVIEVKGNLLKSKCTVIAHWCNCFNKRGAGIAAQIKKKWPGVYEADCKTQLGDKNKLGTFTFYSSKTKLIYSLYTQYAYGTYMTQLKYDALETALIVMKQNLINKDLYISCKIGMPKIGCGLAGGDWNIVKDIIEKVFDDKDIYIYSL